MSTKPAVEMQAPPKTKGLFAKLCEAGNAIGWIEKSGRNEFHKYAYATEADLVSKLRGELYNRGVFCYPTTLSVERKAVTITTFKGDRQTAITDIMVRWTFVDADSGETFSMDLPGSGEDSGDKGVYKALTGSEKYMLMKSFLIPTGDDPENDKEEPNTPASKPPIQQPTRTSARPAPAVVPTPAQPAGAINKAQVGKFWAEARKHGWNEDSVKLLLKTYGTEHTKDIPADRFTEILDELAAGPGAA